MYRRYFSDTYISGYISGQLTGPSAVAILEAVGVQATACEETPAMSSSGSGPFENAGRKVDEQLGGLGGRLEGEVGRVITFLNDRVVPEVRQNSSVALRAAAEQLSRLAEQLDNRRTQPRPTQETSPNP